ncbi:MAG: hypothetical protein WDO15_18545 [Bacteroidota bacterium]
MGYVTRDMQIIVEDCQNHRPEVIVPQDICVVAGTVIDQDIFGYDPDSDPVKIEAFSQLLSLEPNRAEITFPKPNDFQPSTPTNHAKIVFHWQTACENIKEQPYQVVFKITDNPESGQRLIQFKTWNITVVGHHHSGSMHTRCPRSDRQAWSGTSTHVRMLRPYKSGVV